MMSEPLDEILYIIFFRKEVKKFRMDTRTKESKQELDIEWKHERKSSKKRTCPRFLMLKVTQKEPHSEGLSLSYLIK